METPDDTVSLPLRVCYHCGKAEDEQLKLRKCAGCSFALYCSKECQKAEWKTHKSLCTRGEHKHDEEARWFGFRGEDELSSALTDFITTHLDTLQCYAKAALAFKGGPRYMNNPPRQLEIVLECRHTRGCSLDPASTFEIVDSRWETIAEYTSTPLGALNWRRSAGSREGAQREYGHDPRFAGMLSVKVVVWGFTPTSGGFFPQYRRSAPFLKDLHVSAEDIRKMLADVLVLCVGSIRLGLPLQPIQTPQGVSFAAVPGLLVRSTNKRWNWEPLLRNWEAYLEGSRGIEKVDEWIGDPALQSGRPFEQLLKLIREL